VVGRHPWRSEDLDRTGAKIVAVERAGDIIVEFDTDFAVQAEDALFVCGSFNSLERFQKAFKTTSTA
jgi:K+/H+ antiporter YhaU regulatory subunit KhtT